MTYRQIAKKSGISLDTVRVTMKALMDSNFIRKINNGAYCVNPDVLFKGTRTGRLNVLLQYQALIGSLRMTKPLMLYHKACHDKKMLLRALRARRSNFFA